MTVKRAKEIYYDSFWKVLNLTGIEDPLLCLHIFDMAVNSGCRTAVKLIQEVVNVAQDGIIGAMTKRAINEFKPEIKQLDGKKVIYDIVHCYSQAREYYYRKVVARNPKMAMFLQGWLNRIENTHF